MGNISFQSSSIFGGTGRAFVRGACTGRNKKLPGNADWVTIINAVMPIVGYGTFNTSQTNDSNGIVYDDSWPGANDTISWLDEGPGYSSSYTGSWLQYFVPGGVTAFGTLQFNLLSQTNSGSVPNGLEYSVTSVTPNQVNYSTFNPANGANGNAVLQISNSAASLSSALAATKTILNQITPTVFMQLAAVAYTQANTNVPLFGQFLPANGQTPQIGNTLFTLVNNTDLTAMDGDTQWLGGFPPVSALACDQIVGRGAAGLCPYWYGALIGDNYGNLSATSAPLSWPIIAGSFPPFPLSASVTTPIIYSPALFPAVASIAISSMSVMYFSGQNGLGTSGLPPFTPYLPNKSVYSMTLDPTGGSPNPQPLVGANAIPVSIRQSPGYLFFGPSWLSTMGANPIVKCPAGGMIGLSPTVIGW
jgi:hypothetical protein